MLHTTKHQKLKYLQNAKRHFNHSFLIPMAFLWILRSNLIISYENISLCKEMEPRQMLHLSSLRTISICSELWNQIVLPTFLFSIDIFYEYDTRNQHSHATHASLPRNCPCAKSGRHSYLPCDQTQPRPMEIGPAATILLWSKIKCGYISSSINEY